MPSRAGARSASRSARGRPSARPRADTYLLTEARYRNGIDSFLGSLDAQRSYYAAQRTLVLSRLEAATNLVDLYRSLGGDFCCRILESRRPPRQTILRQVRGTGRSAPWRPAPLTLASCASDSANVRSASSKASEFDLAFALLGANDPGRDFGFVPRCLERLAATKRVGVGRQRRLGFFQRAKDRPVELRQRFLRACLGAGDARPARSVIAERPADQRAQQEADRAAAEQLPMLPALEPSEPPSVTCGYSSAVATPIRARRRGEPALGRTDVGPAGEQLRSVADRDRPVEPQRSSCAHPPSEGSSAGARPVSVARRNSALSRSAAMAGISACRWLRSAAMRAVSSRVVWPISTRFCGHPKRSIEQFDNVLGHGKALGGARRRRHRLAPYPQRSPRGRLRHRPPPRRHRRAPPRHRGGRGRTDRPHRQRSRPASKLVVRVGLARQSLACGVGLGRR